MSLTQHGPEAIPPLILALFKKYLTYIVGTNIVATTTIRDGPGIDK